MPGEGIYKNGGPGHKQTDLCKLILLTIVDFIITCNHDTVITFFVFIYIHTIYIHTKYISRNLRNDHG